MSKIKLSIHGLHQFISKASGEKASPLSLKIYEIYLYKNRYKCRKIIGIEGDMVYWVDIEGGEIDHGLCKKSSFVSACPTIATTEEISFLTLQKRQEG